MRSNKGRRLHIGLCSLHGLSSVLSLDGIVPETVSLSLSKGEL